MSVCCIPLRCLTLSRQAPPPPPSSSLSPTEYLSVFDYSHPIKSSFEVVMGIADGPCSGHVRGEGEPHYRFPLRSCLPSLQAGKIPQRNKAIKNWGKMGPRRHQGPPVPYKETPKNPTAWSAQQLLHRKSRGPDLGGVGSQTGRVACLAHLERCLDDNSG